MALTKRTYVDGETIITAQNLNDIQDEVIANGNNKANKSATVSTITYNSNSNHKLTKTINGTTTDVMTVDTSPTDGSLNPITSDAAYDLKNTIDTKLPTSSIADVNITENGVIVAPVRDTATNKPPNESSRYGSVIHYASSSNYGTQIYHSAGINGSLWIRKKISGTWGDWHKVITDEVTQGTATPASTLPSGVTSVDVQYVKCGQVVTVYMIVGRNSTSITSYTTVASGLPIPAAVPTTSGGSNYPLASITVSGTQGQRPLQVYVNSSGSLRINYGAAEGNYMGTFTYITSEV